MKKLRCREFEKIIPAHKASKLIFRPDYNLSRVFSTAMTGAFIW